jgi:heme oxygenase
MDRTMAAPAGSETAAARTGSPGVQKSADLRFLLRDATDAAHRRLDAGFAAWDLSRRADYAAFLRGMEAAFVPLEQWLDGVDPAFLPPDWAIRRRAEALRADLIGIGGVEIPRSTAALRTPEAEAPGILYVLEGSRLGGQVLLRQVLASPDPLVRAHARFLRHGEGQRLWASFAAWLSARPVQDHDAAARGALRAFALFEAVQTAG